MSTTETPAAAKTPQIAYTLTTANEIVRQGPGSPPVVLGWIKENKVSWATPEAAKFLPPVVKFLKARGIEAEILPFTPRQPVERVAVCLSTGREEDEPVTGNTGPTAAVMVDPDGVDGMRTLSVEQRKAVNHLRALEGYPLGELERPAPPLPVTTSGAGDKTPAYVRHLLRYEPKEFVRRYGVIGLGEIEITIPGEIDPVTRIKKPARRKWEPGYVIAKRATIFTHVQPQRRRELDKGSEE